MDDGKSTNDMAEFTNGSAENHKPIPVIETDIENTDIEQIRK